MKRFNDWLGSKLAYWLSTMTMFYVVTFGTLVTLYFDTPKGVQGWLIYWISVFFQAVALPVLGYVSNLAGARQEKILKETHDAVLEELAIVREELEIAKEERELLKKLIEKQ